MYQPEQPYLSITVPTVDTLRYSTLLKAALEHNACVLLIGESGVGKTLVVTTTLDQAVDPQRMIQVEMGFSAQTSSCVTQVQLESRLERVAQGVWGAPAGKRIAVFIDDINLPTPEQYGAQPPIELLRQLKVRASAGITG